MFITGATVTASGELVTKVDGIGTRHDGDGQYTLYFYLGKSELNVHDCGFAASVIQAGGSASDVTVLTHSFPAKHSNEIKIETKLQGQPRDAAFSFVLLVP